MELIVAARRDVTETNVLADEWASHALPGVIRAAHVATAKIQVPFKSQGLLRKRRFFQKAFLQQKVKCMNYNSDNYSYII